MLESDVQKGRREGSRPRRGERQQSEMVFNLTLMFRGCCGGSRGLGMSRGKAGDNSQGGNEQGRKEGQREGKGQHRKGSCGGTSLYNNYHDAVGTQGAN